MNLVDRGLEKAEERGKGERTRRTIRVKAQVGKSRNAWQATPTDIKKGQQSNEKSMETEPIQAAARLSSESSMYVLYFHFGSLLFFPCLSSPL